MSPRLYTLPPLGLYTGLGESQTSFLSRLAEAHSVSVGTLIGKVIAPILGKTYLTNSSEAGGSGFYGNGFELNGFGIVSEDFARVLSKLTGCNTLRNLSLLPLHDILTNRGTLRQTKAWCPMCFEEWKSSNKDIYEPLLWSIKAVNICRTHGITLKTQCPQCEKEIPMLSRKSRNGFCSFCGCWLGSTELELDRETTVGQASLDYFIAKNIEELLEMKDNPGFRPSVEEMYIFLKAIIDKAGGRVAFSKKFNVPLTTARYWYEGRHIPFLRTFLEICYMVGIDIREIFGVNKIDLNSASYDNVYILPEKHIKVSLVKRSYDWNIIENILRSFISNDDTTYPSVHEVAMKIGCDKKLLYRHFPNLCKEIAKKHSAFVHAQKIKRIDEGCQRINEVIKVLYDSGIYPSRRKIESLLPPNILLREKAYQKAWKESIRNSGLTNQGE
nr:TniQ family protein [Desulfosporosinus sp. FKB]